MAVLMTYHKLVERDSKNVDVHWKAASITLLVFSILSSFGISWSLQKIIEDFDNHCILDASLVFHNKSSSMLKMNQSEDSSSVVVKRSFVPLAEIFNESYANFLEKDSVKEYPVEQARLFQDSEISLDSTVWGKQVSCDFGVFIPVFQSIFGIIMTTMFAICGRGGRTDPQSFLPQPWRIVSPALIFFLVMTILSIVNLVLIESGMSNLCKSFRNHVSDIDCNVALNRYAFSTNVMEIPTSIFHQLVTSFNYITFGLWFISLLVVLARIMFVVDFQLVRVTVKTIEFEKTNESTKFKVVEVEQNGNDERNKLATTEC